MAEIKGTFPKPIQGEKKCKKCRGIIEGNQYVKIAGKLWHKDCAIQSGKSIPREYQQDNQ